MAAIAEEALVDVGALIVSTPGYVGGKPRIAGTRMPVHTIAAYHLHEGFTAEQIHEQVFPHLELLQVYAALAYFYANRAQIEKIWDDDERFIAQLTRDHPEGLGPERVKARGTRR